MEYQGEEAINSFEKGMNLDIAKTLYQPGNYLEAYNMTLITDKGLSTAVLQNKKGNKLLITFPTSIPETEYETNGEQPVTVPEQNNFTLIGGCSIQNYHFLFTASKTVSNDTYEGYGQIWRFTYDFNGNINGSTATVLNITSHLAYNRQLNFSLYNRVKALGRYENANAIRLYWADNRNSLRTLNVAGNISTIVQYPVRAIDITSKVNFDFPLLMKLIPGNLPEGRAQVCYRLINRAGAITSWSPASQLIDLILGDEQNSELDYPYNVTTEFDKDKEVISSEKGIQVLIKNIDKDYNYIQLALVHYSEPDQPEIYVYPEKIISTYTDLYETITDLDNSFNILPEELVAFYNIFDICKTIEIKENILYAANTKEEQFDVDYDARAYRFKAASDPIAKLYEEGDSYGSPTTTILASTSVWPIATNLDLINPYNNEDNNNPLNNSDWITNSQYKYQLDGVTPGGTGPNVTYRFIQKALENDETALVNINKAPLIRSPKDNSTWDTGDNNGSFSSLKSPYYASAFPGYARGEVYRFGLVFFSKKNKPSYVKWIGDIRMPEASEFQTTPGTYDFDINTVSGNTVTVNSLGIHFDIYIPVEISEVCSKCQVVYVPREDKDKTRFGMGITGGFLSWDKLLLNTLMELRIVMKATIYINIFQKFSNLSAASDQYDIVDLMADKLVSNYWNKLDDILTTSNISNVYKAGNPDVFLDLLEETLEGAVNFNGFFSGNGITKLISPMRQRILKESIIAAAREVLQRKIAGIGPNVLSLGGATSNYITNSDGDKITVAYVKSPIIDFDTYNFKSGDYLKIIKYFDVSGGNSTEVHRDTTTGFKRALDVSYYIKKWYKGIMYAFNRSHINSLTINNQKVLDPGEILGTSFDNSFFGDVSGTDNPYVISNAFIFPNPSNGLKGMVTPVWLANQTPPYEITCSAGTINFFDSSYDEYFYNHSTLGIGDKKHLFISNTDITTINLPTPATALSFDEESNHNGDPNELPINFCRNICYDTDLLVSYERYPNNQYGGNTHSARSNNYYIPCSRLMTTKEDSTLDLDTWQGDTYVGVYGLVDYTYYYEQIRRKGYLKPDRVKKGLGDIFPCEAPFNFNLRVGEHLINNLSPDDLDEDSEFKTEQRERKASKILKNIKANIKKQDTDPARDILKTRRFLLSEFKYNPVYHQKNNIFKYYPLPLQPLEVITNEYRIWASKAKLDGEFLDSWRNFAPNDYLDVEGTFGPISELIVQKNHLKYYQTNAIGIASTNERSAVTTDNGAKVVLSNGQILSRYDYQTKNTGTSSQFSVVQSDKSVYHYDRNLKKIFRDGECISDIGGIASYLRETFRQSLINFDASLVGVGVHAIFDNEYNTIYFTFLNAVDNINFTIAYNEDLNCFESFFSFKPNIYIKLSNNNIISNSSDTKLYIHNKGDYGSFYEVYYPSSIKLLTNPHPKVIKRFDNVYMQTEVYDTNNINLEETFDTIQCETEYQNSGVVNLVLNTNLGKKERIWTTKVPRDTVTPSFSTISKPKMRDAYLKTTLTFNNEDDKRLICHPILTYYLPSN